MTSAAEKTPSAKPLNIGNRPNSKLRNARKIQTVPEVQKQCIKCFIPSNALCCKTDYSEIKRVPAPVVC